jgi:hypothetical protein
LLTSDLGPGPVIGGLLPRNAADDAIESLCTTLTEDIRTIIISVQTNFTPVDDTPGFDLMLAVDVFCNGTSGPAVAQTIATNNNLTGTISTNNGLTGGIDSLAIDSAQTVADKDVNLPIDEQKGDAPDSVHDICTSVFEFIEIGCTDVDPTIGMCDQLSTKLSVDCGNAIAAIANGP